MIDKNGVALRELFMKEFPSTEEILEKPKAIIECYKEIPCNPCETSCPFDAIEIGEDINKRPEIDFEKCTGCGICAYSCPGLAISIRELDKETKKAQLKFPYEFTPRPKEGHYVNVVDRSGEFLSEAKVIKVIDRPRQNKTALVHVEVDEQYLYDAATIEVIR